MTEQQHSSSSRLISFYLGKEPDYRRRWIDEVWAWDYDQLEQTHDYIQWLFPLKEKSGFNPTAPVLTDESIHAFRSSENLRGRLLRSLGVMLAFYALCCKADTARVQIVRSNEYEARKEVWVRPSNHNHLRLTRILTSLRLLGLEEHATALFECLSHIYQEEGSKISAESYRYWKATLITD